jgi:hypothetical protein
MVHLLYLSFIRLRALQQLKLSTFKLKKLVKSLPRPIFHFMYKGITRTSKQLNDASK